MASLNGGIVGVDNTPEKVSSPEVITTFNASGTLTTQPGTVTVDYLVIAGGGAGGRGGYYGGGGGGAGGYRTGPAPVSGGSPYPIVVGAGAASGSGDSVNGSDSSALGIISNGGGGGGGFYGRGGDAGGSGGGGSLGP